MAMEHACARVVHKPWGSTDLRPWSERPNDGAAIGEIWFDRADASAPPPALLLKLLFTTQPLSIQVHPDDAFARSIGLEQGKTEAWCILSAAPDAQIAIGLKRRLTAPQLRAAIGDGSIAGLVQWRPARKDDVVLVPAGTIHAIGPGLVIAEIQQRSDATFRLFDHGRRRELHVDHAVAVANPAPAEDSAAPRRLTDVRTLLAASRHFVVERIVLPPKSAWMLRADRETWLLVLAGHARVGLVQTFVGEAIFLDAERARVEAGSEGLEALVAYTGTVAIPNLLRHLRGTESGADALQPYPAAAASPRHALEARP